jgi:hypothetical protein
LIEKFAGNRDLASQEARKSSVKIFAKSGAWCIIETEDWQMNRRLPVPDQRVFVTSNHILRKTMVTFSVLVLETR